MGNFLNRLMDYPIKRQPICFHRPQDHTSTGGVNNDVNLHVQGKYEYLIQEFYVELLAVREKNQLMLEKNQRANYQQVQMQFPGWSELTVANLHSLFTLFSNPKNGMINFKDLCILFESLGDKTADDVREERFKLIDKDGDGWISYDEYLQLVYTFNEPDGNGALSGLPKKCFDVSENIRFVNNLSIGDQLEFGLY